MKIDDILNRVGLKYEDLRSDERETLDNWMKALQSNKITVESIREYLKTMRGSVEEELTQTKNGSKKDLFLKARLKNYMLLEAFLDTPEKARKALEASLANLGR